MLHYFRLHPWSDEDDRISILHDFLTHPGLDSDQFRNENNLDVHFSLQEFNDVAKIVVARRYNDDRNDPVDMRKPCKMKHIYDSTII